MQEKKPGQGAGQRKAVQQVLVYYFRNEQMCTNKFVKMLFQRDPGTERKQKYLIKVLAAL